MRHFSTPCLAIVMAAGLTGPAAAQTLFTLTPVRDNTLFEENGAVSNGAGQHLFAGNTSQGNARRALLAFDVAAALPAGATVTSATLTLRMTKTTAGTETISLHRVTAAWGEATSDAGGEEGSGTPAAGGDATWSHAFFDATAWQHPGGDFGEAASASTLVGGNGSYDFASAQLTADVQAWLDDPGANFGWILVGNEGGNTTAKRFDSREAGSTGPALRITISDATPVERGEGPGSLMLRQNQPNPFTASTVIAFSVPRAGPVVLRVFNVLGQQVATLLDGVLPPGDHTATWGAEGLPGGLYFYRIEAGGQVLTRVTTLLR